MNNIHTPNLQEIDNYLRSIFSQELGVKSNNLFWNSSIFARIFTGLFSPKKILYDLDYEIEAQIVISNQVLRLQKHCLFWVILRNKDDDYYKQNVFYEPQYSIFNTSFDFFYCLFAFDGRDISCLSNIYSSALSKILKIENIEIEKINLDLLLFLFIQILPTYNNCDPMNKAVHNLIDSIDQLINFTTFRWTIRREKNQIKNHYDLMFDFDNVPDIVNKNWHSLIKSCYFDSTLIDRKELIKYENLFVSPQLKILPDQQGWTLDFCSLYITPDPTVSLQPNTKGTLIHYSIDIKHDFSFCIRENILSDRVFSARHHNLYLVNYAPD